MNNVAKEIASYLGSASYNDEEFLEHYGIKRRSGRYPWGSGKDPYQHTMDFLSRIEELRKSGWTETPENIKREFNMKYVDYKREKSLCYNERQIYRIATAKRLRDKEGLNTSEIGRRMGVNESVVRGWFAQDEKGKVYKTRETADFLKKRVDEDKMIDIGKNVEKRLGISRERLETAVLMLKRQGYHTYPGRISNDLDRNRQTSQLVLASPEIKHKEIFEYDRVKTLDKYVSRDGGDTYEKRFTYPTSMDSKRLQIRYAEDGGESRDGLVEIRRGVPDLSLGESRYSQVRILVDNSHYIKGMAVYSDDKDMPPGVDVIFNTNKHKDKSKMECLKPIKDDPENPFGSAIKDVELGGQNWYIDEKTGKKKLGLINKRADEGDWKDWKDSLPSQFLSKQSLSMAKKQLDLAKVTKEAEFDEIKSLTNPTIKKYYLEKFASNCDSAAVDLKAAALPGQKYHVIIPNNTLKDNEIYAPGYENGTKLALIRYPHGGTFEIPICTVNNKNQLGKKIIGNTSIDAVCVNHNVASRLSGADFDGDTVMCIPTNDKKGKVKITSTDPLKDLTTFDNKLEYGYTSEKTDKNGEKHYYRGDREIRVMKNTDNEMGKISNLITDMTLQGANTQELTRAVRHSMVVIDAEKHKLDYRQSYIDNNIDELKNIYQPRYDENGNLTKQHGAFTLISKSKGPVRVNRRKGEARINQKGKSWYDPSKPEGSLIYKDAPDNELYYADAKYDKKTHMKTIKKEDGGTITYDMNSEISRKKYDPVMRKDNKTGEVYYTNRDGTIRYLTRKRTMDSKNMKETTDARTLISTAKHPMEIIYADYANSMKDLANKARLELLNTPNLKQNSNAKKIYAKEVSSLDVKLNNALINSIKERDAKRKTASYMNKKKEDNPDLKGEDLRKLTQRTLDRYRKETGAIPRRNRSIKIEDKEWEAIQAGAISERKLKDILNNSDPDILREKAMPKDKVSLSQAQINRIKAMSLSNFTLKEIAEKMHLSTSTISKYLKGV